LNIESLLLEKAALGADPQRTVTQGLGGCAQIDSGPLLGHCQCVQQSTKNPNWKNRPVMGVSWMVPLRQQNKTTVADYFSSQLFSRNVDTLNPMEGWLKLPFGFQGKVN